MILLSVAGTGTVLVMQLVDFVREKGSELGSGGRAFYRRLPRGLETLTLTLTAPASIAYPG